MATAKKTTSKATTTKTTTVPKAELTPICVLKLGPVARRATKSQKGKLYSLLTKKGQTYRALLDAAKKEGLPTDRVRVWIPRWVRKQYLVID